VPRPCLHTFRALVNDAASNPEGNDQAVLKSAVRGANHYSHDSFASTGQANGLRPTGNRVSGVMEPAEDAIASNSKAASWRR
jgi:hypothetical protein